MLIVNYYAFLYIYIFISLYIYYICVVKRKINITYKICLMKDFLYRPGHSGGWCRNFIFHTKTTNHESLTITRKKLRNFFSWLYWEDTLFFYDLKKKTRNSWNTRKINKKICMWCSVLGNIDQLKNHYEFFASVNIEL